VAAGAVIGIRNVHPASPSMSELVGRNGQLLPRIFNFGRAEAASMVNHTFTIWNPFDHALTVGKIRMTCRCTVVDQAPKSIAAGARAEIKLSVDVGPYAGPLLKTAVVEFLEHASVELRVEGDVIERWPRDVDFGEFKRGDAPERVAIIRSVSGTPIAFKTLRYDESMFTVVAANGTPNSPEGILHIRIGPNLPYGGFDSPISFVTNEAAKGEPTSEVHGYVLHAIEPRERTVAFGIIGAGQTTVRDVTVYSPYDYPISLSDVLVSTSSRQFVEVGGARQVAGDTKIPISIAGGFAGKVLAGDITITALVNGKPEQTKVDFYAMAGQ
jgi:uncharacterized protein DUF1573